MATAAGCMLSPADWIGMVRLVADYRAGEGSLWRQQRGKLWVQHWGGSSNAAAAYRSSTLAAVCLLKEQRECWAHSLALDWHWLGIEETSTVLAGCGSALLSSSSFLFLPRMRRLASLSWQTPSDTTVTHRDCCPPASSCPLPHCIGSLSPSLFSLTMSLMHSSSSTGTRI